MLIKGQLNRCLTDIDNQTEEMYHRLIEEMAERQGVKEQLKATGQMAWVGKMSNIRACAGEVVGSELIYA